MKANKWLLIALAASVLFVGWYFFLRGGDIEDTGALVSEDGSATVALTASELAGQELLVLLDQLKQIELDDSVFSDPAFRSLVDFRETLPTQSAGRSNPFAPAGSN